MRGPWSVGIVGLVAARLVEDRGRPAVVGADLGDVIRASCRSDGSLDLGAALEQCARPVHPLSAGMPARPASSCPTERWDAFRERFLRLAAETAPPDPRVSIAIDLALPASEVDYGLYRELAGLAPCGPGNPDPLVAVLGLTVTRVRAATGGHSQLTLRRERDVLDGIAFGRSDIAEIVREGDRLDVVARLTSRRFGGFESLQLDIRDVATSGSQPGSAAVLGASDVERRARGEPLVTPPVAPGPRPAIPVRLGSIGRWLAPTLAIAGLLVIALVTLDLLQGGVPFVGTRLGGRWRRRRWRRRHRRAARDGDTVERGRRATGRRVASRARSSTRRTATSGSRRTRTPSS